MKPFATLLALTLLANTATAQSFDMGSLTPTLSFPAPKGGPVTKTRQSPGN